MSVKPTSAGSSDFVFLETELIEPNTVKGDLR